MRSCIQVHELGVQEKEVMVGDERQLPMRRRVVSCQGS